MGCIDDRGTVGLDDLVGLFQPCVSVILKHVKQEEMGWGGNQKKGYRSKRQQGQEHQRRHGERADEKEQVVDRALH